MSKAKAKTPTIVRVDHASRKKLKELAAKKAAEKPVVETHAQTQEKTLRSVVKKAGFVQLVVPSDTRDVAENLVRRGVLATSNGTLFYAADAIQVKRRTKVDLTASDIQKLREERETDDARIDLNTRDLETVKARAKAIQGEIDKLSDEGLRRSRTIRDGFDYRDVLCFQAPGWDTRNGSSDRTGMGTYVVATGECVDWRELSTEERQSKLF